MTKAQGFARGDLDTSFALDDKFVELRASVDPATYYAATGVYFHLAAATWREAERKTAGRTVPDAPELIAHLVRVGLLDGEQRITRRAFSHSVGRALVARRTTTERKQRQRTGMSRGTHRDGRVTDAESQTPDGVSTDIQSRAVQSSTDQIRAGQSEQSGSAPSGARARGGLKAIYGDFSDIVKSVPGGKA